MAQSQLEKLLLLTMVMGNKLLLANSGSILLISLTGASISSLERSKILLKQFKMGLFRLGDVVSRGEASEVPALDRSPKTGTSATQEAEVDEC